MTAYSEADPPLSLSSLSLPTPPQALPRPGAREVTSSRRMSERVVGRHAVDSPSAKVSTGLTDSTHSSSASSAVRYHLDEEDQTPILLYKYRAGLETSSQKDLCVWLNNDERRRVTKKLIPRLASYVDVRRHDLFLPEEKENYYDLPNYESSVASIKLPSHAYWSKVLFGRYSQLFIVSPETSPNCSLADDDSQRTSLPPGTWSLDCQEDTRAGALDDGKDVALKAVMTGPA